MIYKITVDHTSHLVYNVNYRFLSRQDRPQFRKKKKNCATRFYKKKREHWQNGVRIITQRKNLVLNTQVSLYCFVIKGISQGLCMHPLGVLQRISEENLRSFNALAKYFLRRTQCSVIHADRSTGSVLYRLQISTVDKLKCYVSLLIITVAASVLLLCYFVFTTNVDIPQMRRQV